jgi:putative ABC transport system permease protein
MLRLPQSLRNGFRMLRQVRGLAIVAVLTLGIAVNVAVFAVVHAVLVRPLPHPEPERLIAVWFRNLTDGREHQMAPLDFFDFERGTRSFERMAAYYPPGFTLTGGGVAERIPGARASSGIFEVLGVRPFLGRSFTPADDTAGTAAVAVISHRLWVRRFGSDRSIVGRSIVLSGRPYTVVGVLPAGVETPALWPRMPDVWVPIGLDANVDSRDARMLRVLGRLRGDVSVEQARADLERIAQGLSRTFPESHATTGVTMRPLLEELTADIRPSLLMLLGGVAALLLVSAGNAASLILAGTLQRRYEFSTRLALGATRRQLIRQIVSENVVLGAVGAVAGFGLAYAASDRLVAVAAAAGVPRASEIQVGTLALAASFGLSLLCATICAAVAGFTVVKRSAGNLAPLDGRVSATHRRTYAVLLTVQTAFSLALLTGAGLLVRSFYELQAVDPGFDSSRTYTTRLSPPSARYPAGPVLAGFYDQAVERVRTLPGVESAAVVDWLPASGWGSVTGFTLRSSEARHLAELRIVGSGYFDTMSIPLVAGRVFDGRDRESSSRVVVVNESFARAHFAGTSAVGQSVRFDRGDTPFTAEIVGVIRDVREMSRRLSPTPGVYAPKAQPPWRNAETRELVVRMAGDIEPPSVAIQAVFRDLEPDMPIAPLEPLAEVTSMPIVRTQLYASAVLMFAIVAVMLAAFGIYGVVSAVVVQGSREIGIRMALGATSVRVIADAARRGVLPTAVGVFAGAPLAVGAGRLVRSQLFGVQPTDIPTLVFVATVTVAVAITASVLPARRAAHIDPAVSLRDQTMA